MLAVYDVKIVTKLTLAFMSLSAVTLGVSAFSYTRLASIDQSSAQAVHSYAVLQSIDGVISAMVNQETGVRGYLIAGDAKFLAPYTAGQTAFQENLERVASLTSDNQTQQNRVGALKRAAEAWSNEIAAKASSRPETWKRRGRWKRAVPVKLRWMPSVLKRPK
jgi:methyl-accepting chemotaxis protein